MFLSDFCRFFCPHKGNACTKHPLTNRRGWSGGWPRRAAEPSKTACRREVFQPARVESLGLCLNRNALRGASEPSPVSRTPCSPPAFHPGAMPPDAVSAFCGLARISGSLWQFPAARTPSCGEGQGPRQPKPEAHPTHQRTPAAHSPSSSRSHLGARQGCLWSRPEQACSPPENLVRKRPNPVIQQTSTQPSDAPVSPR